MAVVLEREIRQAIITIAKSLERIAAAQEEANKAHYLTAANSSGGWACRCGWTTFSDQGQWHDHRKEG